MRVYDHLDPSLMDIRSEFTVKDYLSVDQVRRCIVRRISMNQ